MNTKEKINDSNLDVIIEIPATKGNPSRFDAKKVVNAINSLMSDYKTNTLLMKVVSKNGYVDRLSYDIEPGVDIVMDVLDYYDYWPEYDMKNFKDELEKYVKLSDGSININVSNLKCELEKMSFVYDKEADNIILMVHTTN